MRSYRSRMAGLLSIILIFIHAFSACAAADALPQGALVGYLGPEGTYTEEAAKLFFGEDCEFVPRKTVAETVQMVLSGECDFAVIPQENTIGGPVYNYLDELLAHEGLSITGEIELPIRQALLVREGTSAEDIAVVYSHAQGIAQGSAWLAENLPGVPVTEVSSTAEGAKMVSECENGDCAAIASTGAAEVYGLEIMAYSIQQNDDNKTRFYVLSAEDAANERGDRMVFTASGDASALPALMDALHESGVELVGIHDRTSQTVLGEYIYLIECADAGYEEFEIFSAVPGFEFHYYGAFPLR